MQAGLVIVWAWSIGALVVTVLCAYCAIRFLIKAHKYSIVQENLVKLVEKRTREKYNAIATLPQQEFGNFLAISFAKMLELKSASQISEVDPEAEEKLYAEATAALIDYLGPDTIDAIDYYYGDDYIHRWAKASYMLLIKRGISKNIIKKETQFETTAKHLI